MKKPLIHEGVMAERTVFTCNDMTYILFDIDLGEELDASPGQFIMLETGNESYLDRPFSILRLSERRLGLLIEVKGAGTRKLLSMETGSAVRFKGVYGNGLGSFNDHADKELVLIAGGMGVVPIFHLCSQFDMTGGGRIKMFFGARSRSFFDALDHHLQFSETLGELETYLVPFEETGKTVVNVFIEYAGENGAPEHVISCGPEGMLKLVQDFVIEKEISGELIMERRMACGRGMCMACPVMISDGETEIMKMACTHGPVFSVGRGRKVIF